MAGTAYEAERIAELHGFHVLDTDPEEAFDSITRIVAATCDVPIALLSFVDADRQWFKSRVGLNVCETSRDSSFCSRAIAEPSDLFLVPDTHNDPRFQDNPLVLGEPFIRFYAGVPIVSHAGLALGSLCVIDKRPRQLTSVQISVLKAGANAVLGLLHYRRATSNLQDVITTSDRAGVAGQFPALTDIQVRTSVEIEPETLESDDEIPVAVINALPGAFFVLDSAGKLLLWNRRLQDVSGYRADELRQLLAIQLFEKHDAPRVAEQIMRGFIQGEAHLDADVMTKDGRTIPYFFTSSAVEFKGHTCLVGMGIDISDRKRAEKLLRHSALHDPLTNLANRRLLDERLTLAAASAREDGRCAAVMFLDLDRFKVINDTIGHRSGDELLTLVGQRLQEALRFSDTVARLGGDEFVVVAILKSPGDATFVAEQILNIFRQPFVVSGMDIYVTASVGISISPQDGVYAEDLLRNADIAMYIAKDRGRNNYFSYASEMHVAAKRRLATENDLRRALENNEFELFYQPAVDLETGLTVAAEALIRWHHPNRGLLPPSEFIEIAEECGLIVPIGAWVLKEGARMAKRLQTLRLPPCHISVNVSGRQLRDPAFPAHVHAAVDGLELQHESLGIEITESAALGDPETATAVLMDCKRLGLLVLLDDFGTHYSSLTYLKKFPIDIIKIDKSFVDGLPHDADDTGIVKAIIGLASTVDCDILAEGVETTAQALWLKENRCRIATGYLYAKPMRSCDFEIWLGREAFPHHTLSEDVCVPTRLPTRSERDPTGAFIARYGQGAANGLSAGERA